jgi:hypothetical protein
MRKILLAAVVVLASLNVMTSPANAITKKDVAKQVTLERVYGPKYGQYYGKYGLDWNKNGCSIPGGLAAVSPAAYAALKAWGSFFRNSCDRHDFGYRNKSVHGYSRATVDAKFKDNMIYQCKHKDWPGPDAVAEKPCIAAANVIYGGVRAGGGFWW